MTVSLFAETINERCHSAPIVFMVFPSKQFHFIVDTSTTKSTDSVNISRMVWSDSNLQPVTFCMVMTVPTAPILLGLEWVIEVESFWVDDFKLASILTEPPKFLFGLDFVTRDLKFNWSIFLNTFPLLFCGDNDAFCVLKSKTGSSSDSLSVIGSSCSFLFSWFSSYPYNTSWLVKQELDISCLFNPYSEELPYTKDKMDITFMKSNLLSFLLRVSVAT